MRVDVQHKNPKKLLNPASGYLTGYNYTLNPYTGCAFACSYCYVRKLPVALFRNQEWGTWVDVKEGAATQLKKELIKAKKKGPVTIFMSSSTDPYQPLEYKEKITRSMLEVMVQEQPDFLFVQTRGPLVTRDIDLFLQLKDRVRISMTVETDIEKIRKEFSPATPPIQARLNALQRIVDSGIPAQATIAPLLPCTEEFAKKLAQIVNRVCIDDFFMGDGSKGKRTEKLRIKDIYDDLQLSEWYSTTSYLHILAALREEFQDEQIFISQKGFLP